MAEGVSYASEINTRAYQAGIPAAGAMERQNMAVLVEDHLNCVGEALAVAENLTMRLGLSEPRPDKQKGAEPMPMAIPMQMEILSRRLRELNDMLARVREQIG